MPKWTHNMLSVVEKVKCFAVPWSVLICYGDEWIMGRGFLIYQKVLGNMPGCQQKWLHTRTRGLYGVTGGCPTLHQSRV